MGYLYNYSRNYVIITVYPMENFSLKVPQKYIEAFLIMKPKDS